MARTKTTKIGSKGTKTVIIRDETGYKKKKKAIRKKETEAKKGVYYTKQKKKRQALKRYSERGKFGRGFFPEAKELTDRQKQLKDEYTSFRSEVEGWYNAREFKKRSESAKKGVKTRKINKEKKARTQEFLKTLKKLDVVAKELEEKADSLERFSINDKNKARKKAIQKDVDKTRAIIKKFREISYEMAIKIHHKRSLSAQAKDNKSLSKNIAKDIRWSRDPGKYDYPGVDTPDTKKDLPRKIKEIKGYIKGARGDIKQSKIYLTNLKSNLKVAKTQKRFDDIEEIQTKIEYWSERLAQEKKFIKTQKSEIERISPKKKIAKKTKKKTRKKKEPGDQEYKQILKNISQPIPSKKDIDKLFKKVKKNG